MAGLPIVYKILFAIIHDPFDTANVPPGIICGIGIKKLVILRLERQWKPFGIVHWLLCRVIHTIISVYELKYWVRPEQRNLVIVRRRPPATYRNIASAVVCICGITSSSCTHIFYHLFDHTTLNIICYR